jgi:ABC-type nitrate/sulfonate/bicarbonate transport system substrate-binding protein
VSVGARGIVEAMASIRSIHRCNRKEKYMGQNSYSRGTTRRAFVVSLGPGMYVLGMAVANGAPLKKVPTATGIDALYVPFVVAAELKIFEKYGLETSYKPFDDGNVALDALLAGSSDIGATTELGGLSRWDKGGKLYVTSYSSTSGQQIGLAGRDDIKRPEDLIGRTVAYPRASGGHLYFMRYVKKYNLPVDKIKVKFMQAPEMVAALERRDIDAFFLWEPWLDKAAQLVQGARVLARSGDDGVFILTSYDYYSQGLIDDHPRAAAATRALIEATDFCNTNAAEAAKVAGKAFRIPEADMKVYMSRMKYRVEMPKDVVLGNFRGAAEVALGEGIIKKMPDWNDFVRPQLMKEVAPDRAVGW